MVQPVSPRVLRMPARQPAASNCIHCGLTTRSPRKKCDEYMNISYKFNQITNFISFFFSSIGMISALIKISPVEH